MTIDEHQQHQFGPTSRRAEEQRSSTIQTTNPTKRVQSAIAEGAINEFGSLSEFLPSLPDNADTRTLALRIYYLES